MESTDTGRRDRRAEERAFDTAPEAIAGVFDLLQRNPAAALDLAHTAHRLAIESGDAESRANALRVIAYCHDRLADYRSATAYARAARRIYRCIGSHRGLADSLIALGIIARSKTDYASALASFSEALEMFRADGDRIREAAAHNNLGVVYDGIGNYEAALESYLAALTIYDAEGDERNAAIAIGNISIIHFYLGDYERSFDFCMRGLAECARLDMPLSRALLLGNVSSLYKGRGEIDAALGALDEALAIFTEQREQRYRATTLAKLGMLYALRDEPARALRAFRRSERIGREIGSPEIYVDAALRVAELYESAGRYERAGEIAEAGAREAREASMIRTECDLLHVAARSSEKRGAMKRAVGHYKSVVALREIILDAERGKSVAAMQARFDIERGERERELLRLKNRHLEEMMEQKTRELTAMALNLVGKNRLLKGLQHEVEKLARNGATGGGNDLLPDLIGEIRRGLRSDSDWERFEREFEHVHGDFIRRLAGRFARLTPMELKVCALLKLGLSSKEIANLLSVSVRNVEGHRYWIRKKMDLPTNVNLSGYLTAL